LPTHVIKSRVGKLKTRVGKLAEFSLKIFAHPGLNPCRRPCALCLVYYSATQKNCANIFGLL